MSIAAPPKGGYTSALLSSINLGAGCLVRMTSKVEVAFHMLAKQGHGVQAVVQNHAVWFDIDGSLLVSWDQMSDFADGLHTFEELKELYIGNDRCRSPINSQNRKSILHYSMCQQVTLFMTTGNPSDRSEQETECQRR